MLNLIMINELGISFSFRDFNVNNNIFPPLLLMYRTRAIISRSRFEAALVYKPQILSFKKESRNNGRSAA